MVWTLTWHGPRNCTLTWHVPWTKFTHFSRFCEPQFSRSWEIAQWVLVYTFLAQCGTVVRTQLDFTMSQPWLGLSFNTNSKYIFCIFVPNISYQKRYNLYFAGLESASVCKQYMKLGNNVQIVLELLSNNVWNINEYLWKIFPRNKRYGPVR